MTTLETVMSILVPVAVGVYLSIKTDMVVKNIEESIALEIRKAIFEVRKEMIYMPLRRSKEMDGAHLPAITEETIREILNRYFSIGDSYTFELTKVKEAFDIGTMTFDDFQEWSEENTADLADYLVAEINGLFVQHRE